MRQIKQKSNICYKINRERYTSIGDNLIDIFKNINYQKITVI